MNQKGLAVGAGEKAEEDGGEERARGLNDVGGEKGRHTGLLGRAKGLWRKEIKPVT